MNSRIFVLPQQVVVDGGVVSPGALAYFYLTGTSTATDTYTDDALTTPHDNPVEADANGVLPVIYLDPNIEYKLTMNDAADVLIYTEDPVGDTTGAVTKIKTAFTARASTTVLADDDHLAGWNLSANSQYVIEGFLAYSHNVGNFAFDLNFSNLPQTDAWMAYQAFDGAGNAEQDMVTIQTGTDISFTTLADGDNVGVILHGGFASNATTGGTLDFRWAQETSSANNTTLLGRSWIRIQKVA